MAAKTGEVMTLEACLISPEETIAQAALLMREKDVGCLAIGADDKLVGMLTDRDIAIRAVAENKGPETPIYEVMSEGVKYCHDDDDVREVARNMAGLQVRRLPVVNSDKRLVGFISLANIANSGDPGDGAALLEGIATPH